MDALGLVEKSLGRVSDLLTGAGKWARPETSLSRIAGQSAFSDASSCYARPAKVSLAALMTS